MIDFLLIFFFLSTTLGVLIIFRCFNFDKAIIANFVKGVYDLETFEGVRVFQTEEGVNYLITAVTLKKGKSNSFAIVARIASRKAKLSVSQYFSCSLMNIEELNTEVLSITNNNGFYKAVINLKLTKDIFKESSIGCIKGIKLLTKFESRDTNQLVFLFYKKLGT